MLLIRPKKSCVKRSDFSVNHYRLRDWFLPERHWPQPLITWQPDLTPANASADLQTWLLFLCSAVFSSSPGCFKNSYWSLHCNLSQSFSSLGTPLFLSNFAKAACRSAATGGALRLGNWLFSAEWSERIPGAVGTVHAYNGGVRLMRGQEKKKASEWRSCSQIMQSITGLLP